jgi:hypothetical protein
MNLHSKKSMFWTATLILFLAVAIYRQVQWLSLIIPGAILMWCGLITAVRPQRIAVPKNTRTGLH